MLLALLVSPGPGAAVTAAVVEFDAADEDGPTAGDSDEERVNARKPFVACLIPEMERGEGELDIHS